MKRTVQSFLLLTTFVGSTIASEGPTQNIAHPIFAAIEKERDDVDAVKKIVEAVNDTSSLINSRNKKGHTPLQEAIRKGHISIAKFLIENGAKLNISDEKGQTLLHSAARNGQIEIAQLLLENGADVNARDKAGFTPLGSVKNIAKIKERLQKTNLYDKTIKLLLDHEAKE